MQGIYFYEGIGCSKTLKQMSDNLGVKKEDVLNLLKEYEHLLHLLYSFEKRDLKILTRDEYKSLTWEEVEALRQSTSQMLTLCEAHDLSERYNNIEFDSVETVVGTWKGCLREEYAIFKNGDVCSTYGGGQAYRNYIVLNCGSN